MKIAVSIPDDLFAQAEVLAQRARQSRSEVYARALNEYIARHAPDRVTEAMDRVLDDLGAAQDKFTAQAARRTLARTEW